MNTWGISEGNEKCKREQMEFVLYKLNNSLDTSTSAHERITGMRHAIPP